MSNDLDGVFAALSADAGRGRLPSAADVRRRADRRAVRRSIVTAGAAAALLAGAVGTGWALAGNQGQAPLPPVQSAGPSPSPSTAEPAPAVSSAPSSPPPSTTPSTTPPSSAPPSSAPPMPRSIPARAMLRASDVVPDSFKRLDDVWDPTDFCARARYPSADDAAVRASVRLLYRGPDTEPGSIPDDTVYDTVTVYRGEGARDFMDELRAAVRQCPTGEQATRYRSLGSLGLGDASLLVERSYVARDGEGEPLDDGSRTNTYLVAVRVGDAVTLVDCRGYENLASDREDAESLAATAAERLADWRG